jgi:hypothetical protein
MNIMRARLAMVGLAALAGACGSTLGGPALAEEGVAFKNMMGSIGLIPPEKDPIHYRERAPLVLPPKSALPSPRESFASSNPQWPNDPDVAAKRSRAELERSPVTWSETRRMSDNNPRLSPDELRRGRSASSPAPVPGMHRGDNARDVLMLNPDQLGPKSASDLDEKLVNGEPVRKVLTDPPTGMRRSASGKKVEPGFEPRVDQQALDANPMTWLTRRLKGAEDDE